MSNFIQLVINEQIKLYVKKSTWVMFILLAAIAIVGGIITNITDNSNDAIYGDNWRQVLEQENQRIIQEMENMQDRNIEGAPPQEAYVSPQVERNSYHLEHDIQPQPFDAWQYVIDNAGIAMVISLFTVIVAAGIISNEFRWGTIKLLLIRPVSRLKIMISKYVSVLIFAMTLLLFLVIISWIVGAIMFGVNGVNPSIVQAQTDGFSHSSVWTEMIEAYGFKLVNLVMMATFAFMVSTLFRNSGITIGLAVFLMFSGNMIVAIFARYNWAKYILFANTDLSRYTSGGRPLFEEMTMPFSIAVLLVYYLLFMFISWAAFTKRDVAGH